MRKFYKIQKNDAIFLELQSIVLSNGTYKQQICYWSDLLSVT